MNLQREADHTKSRTLILILRACLRVLRLFASTHFSYAGQLDRTHATTIPLLEANDILYLRDIPVDFKLTATNRDHTDVRSNATEMAVSAYSIVKVLDIIEQIRSRPYTTRRSLLIRLTFACTSDADRRCE
jgi:hypothetical protein